MPGRRRLRRVAPTRAPRPASALARLRPAGACGGDRARSARSGAGDLHPAGVGGGARRPRPRRTAAHGLGRPVLARRPARPRFSTPPGSSCCGAPGAGGSAGATRGRSTCRRGRSSVTRCGGPSLPTRRRSVMAGFWESLDLRGEDVVIVPGHAAAQVLAHPTLPAAARVIVVDDHMLAGVEDLRGPWDRVEVHACFPGYAWLYDRAGVPLDSGDVAPVSAAPAALRAIWSTRCQRDHLLRRLAPPRWAHDGGGGGAPALAAGGGDRRRGHGAGRAARAAWHHRFCPRSSTAVRRARFVVLPLRFDPTKAAGITVLAMAFAAGRPVVATATQAMRDHVREGVRRPARAAGEIRPRWRRPSSGWTAIRRCCNRLAAGAQEAGARHSVEAWADQIVHGAPPRAVIEDVGWRAW
jgi:hypothetical protein